MSYIDLRYFLVIRKGTDPEVTGKGSQDKWMGKERANGKGSRKGNRKRS
jgi:hypothetical protein